MDNIFFVIYFILFYLFIYEFLVTIMYITYIKKLRCFYINNEMYYYQPSSKQNEHFY